MSSVRQCALLGLAASSLYYEPVPEAAENLRLMRLIDEEYTAHPFYGSRRMTDLAERAGRGGQPQAGAAADAAHGPGGDLPQAEAEPPARPTAVYPYLLRDVRIERPDQVWSTDITYVPLRHGVHVPGGDHRLVQPLRDGLAAVEHAGRRRSAWRCWRRRLASGQPEVFNTDQGVQFTAAALTGRLEAAGVAVSMDGEGGPGQRVRGAAVAECEVRGRLSTGLRRWSGGLAGVESLRCVL